MRRPLLAVLAAYCVGILAGEFMSVPVWLKLCWLLMALVISGWALYKRFSMTPLFIAVSLILLGIYRMAAVSDISANFISRFVQAAPVSVEGTIVEQPVKSTDGDKGWRVTYICKSEQVVVGHRTQQSQGKLRLTVRQSGEREIYQLGDRIIATGELKLPKSGSNPGQPDFVAYYLRQDIGAVMSISGESVARDSTSAVYLPLRFLQQVRENLGTAMTRGMDDTEAALLRGLVFGERKGIPKEVEWDFADTGLVHILSVSGYHVALLAGSLCWVLNSLGWAEDRAAKSAIVFIGFYVLIVGVSAPVLRSAVMAVILLGAVILRRRKDALHALAVAGVLMLLWDPRQIYDLGFQLSFGATAGLIVLSPGVVRTFGFFPAGAANLCGTTMAATIAVLPILVHQFQQVSLISLVANVCLTIPVSVLIIGGLTAAMLGSIWAPLAYTIIAFNDWLIGVVINCTDILAVVPLGYLFIADMPWWQVGSYYALLTWIFSDRSVYGVPTFKQVWGNLRHRLILITVILCVFWLGQWQTHVHRQLTVTFLDVGQGDAAVIRTPHGHSILLDSGGGAANARGFDYGEKVVIPYLRYAGIRQLDWVMLSHMHEDHAGGARTILRHLPIVRLLAAGEESSSLYREISKLCAQRNIPVFRAQQGQQFELDGVKLEVLNAPEKGHSAENEASAVIRISYGECRFLFTGDLEGMEEKLLVSNNQDLLSTVLKVGHHGSAKGTSELLLAAVRPSTAIISVGNNSFGHPSGSVLERLKKGNVKVYRTDQHGAIVVRTDGQKYEIKAVLPGSN